MSKQPSPKVSALKLTDQLLEKWAERDPDGRDHEILRRLIAKELMRLAMLAGTAAALINEREKVAKKGLNIIAGNVQSLDTFMNHSEIARVTLAELKKMP